MANAYQASVEGGGVVCHDEKKYHEVHKSVYCFGAHGKADEPLQAPFFAQTLVKLSLFRVKASI